MSVFRVSNKRRVAWVIGSQLDKGALFGRVDTVTGGTPLVRYRWLAEVVNSNARFGVKYEIYKPWRRYDAIVFLKAMGSNAIKLMRRVVRKGIPVIFDANVNYYELGGTEYYERMLPTPEQKDQAIQMTTEAMAVIADSEYIESRCRKYNKQVMWIPDSVRIDLVPEYKPYVPAPGKIRLLWCGQAVKLFDLLRIEGVLREFAPYVELTVVTNSLTELERIKETYRNRIKSLLEDIDCRVVPYTNPVRLFDIYTEGGVFLSPRFLDSPYNLGHTEWKISLPMACGRMVLCSPVPSYTTVSKRAKGCGIKLVETDQDWRDAFERLLSNKIDLRHEELSAKGVITKYYSTQRVSKQHTDYIRSVIG